MPWQWLFGGIEPCPVSSDVGSCFRRLFLEFPGLGLGTDHGDELDATEHSVQSVLPGGLVLEVLMRTVLVVFLCVAVCTSLPVPASGQRAGFDDAHMHLNAAAEWLGLMDEAGIQRSIVFRGRDIDNEGLRAAAEQWPGRLIPFVSISPEHREYRGRWEEDDATIVEIVDSLLSGGGFFGVGEISVSHFPGAGFPEADFDPNGNVMRGIMEVARRHDVPVSIHSEVTRLREFEALLGAFPDVAVIWAHGGYTPLFLAKRLLERNPNLIYELSARTWQNHPRSPDYTILANGRDVWPGWLDLVESMPDRFLVGTDAALRSSASDRQKIESVISFLSQLSVGARAKVAYENLARLVGS